MCTQLNHAHRYYLTYIDFKLALLSPSISVPQAPSLLQVLPLKSILFKFYCSHTQFETQTARPRSHWFKLIFLYFLMLEHSIFSQYLITISCKISPNNSLCMTVCCQVFLWIYTQFVLVEYLCNYIFLVLVYRFFARIDNWLALISNGRAYTQRVAPKLALVNMELPTEGWKRTNNSYMGENLK